MAATLRTITNVPVKIAKAVFTYDLTPYNEKFDRLREARRTKAAIDQYRDRHKRREAAKGRTVTEEQMKKIKPEECNWSGY
ncbi:MAG: hypothetical protein A3K25_13720 [Planctomycetes bacterium RIFOXYB12_FULL_42_10]|nr:MAG: hypothetical protein A3K25_13720 [Planctomycetes bacterium RIFOXYB12_FULL_42_10]